MWIIPKNLNISHSVPDTEALTSDSQELSEMLEQSLMWRSKPSSSKTWSQRLRTTCSTWRLFSQTSKPSHGNSLMTEWISSQEASLVSHFREQVDAQEMKTQDTCGPILFEESESWADLPLFSLKMSKESSALSSNQTNGVIPKVRPFCSMSSASWSDWVTMRRREYSQRVKSAPPINESACSSWVCAPISASQDAILFHQCSETQSREGQFWNTPQARDHKGVDQGKEARGFSPSLPNQVQTQHILHQEAQNHINGSLQGLQWATPNTLDHLAQKSKKVLMRQATTVRKGRTVPSNLREQVNPEAVEIYQAVVREHQETMTWSTPTTRDYKGKQSSGYKERRYGALLPDQVHEGTFTGKLNPRWVETLMGLPIGWTMPSCQNPWIITQTSLDCSETESCPTPLNEHLESCGEISTLDELYEINLKAIRKYAPDLPLETVEEEAAYATLEQYHDEDEI